MAQFGRLRINELLDQGEIRTYLADDPRRSGPILLHVLPKQMESNRGFVERVERGLKLVGSSILERGQEAGVEYVLTERFVPHRPFLDWLEDPANAKPDAPRNPDFSKMGRWEIPKFAPAPPIARVDPISSVSGMFSSELDDDFDPLLETQAMNLSETAAMPIPAAAPPPAAATTPGEFTQMFRADSIKDIESAEAQSIPEQPSLPEPRESSPGEFTRMFQAPPREPAHPVSEPASFTQLFKNAPAEQETAAVEGGEFTRLFQGPVEPQTGGFKAPAASEKPPVAQPRPTEPPPQEPGAFTRMFMSPSVPPEPVPQMPPPREDPHAFEKHFEGPLSAANAREFDFDRLKDNPPPRAPPAQRPAGEFTQMFGKPFASESPRPSPRPAMEGATHVFQAPQSPARPPAMSGQGPGEYTRMFARPAADAPAAGPAASAAPPKKAAKASAALIVTLAVLFVLAVALVLFFALKH